MNSKVVIRCFIFINKIYNWKLKNKKEENLSLEFLKVFKSVDVICIWIKKIMIKSVDIGEWIKWYNDI